MLGTLGNALFLRLSDDLIRAVPVPTATPSYADRSAHPSPLPPTPPILAAGEAHGYERLAVPVRERLALDRAGIVELALLVVVIVGFWMTRPTLELRRRLANPGEAIVLIVQVVVVAIGLVGGIMHALWEPANGKGDVMPSFDLVALAYFAFALAGALLPRIQKLGIAGASLEIAVEKAVAVTSDTAGLLDNWIEALNIFLIQIENDRNPNQALMDFLADRADEAVKAIGSVGEFIRISYWTYDSSDATLGFFQGTYITDKVVQAFEFPYGKGCLGRAFKEGRLWNEEDPHALSSWIDIPGAHDRTYRAIMLVPFEWGHEKLGMIAIDREAKQKFGDSAERIAQGLASLVGHAFGAPATRSALARANEADLDQGEKA